MCQAGERQQRIDTLANVIVINHPAVLAVAVVAAICGSARCCCCCRPTFLIAPLLVAVILPIVSALIPIPIFCQSLLLQLLKQTPVAALLSAAAVRHVPNRCWLLCNAPAGASRSDCTTAGLRNS
jgi:hypothetical protein